MTHDSTNAPGSTDLMGEGGKAGKADSGSLRHEAVIQTGVPGLVLWRFPRRVLRRSVDGVEQKVRSRSYSLTHEPSGVALLPGGGGCVAHTLTKAEGISLARKLGDLRNRTRPIDFTRSIDDLRKIRHLTWACFALAGWVGFDDVEDMNPELRRWSEANDVVVVWAQRKEPRAA